MIARDGIAAVSVRTTAAEAGVSAGSLRHVLQSKDELLAAAMRLAIENVTQRFLGAARAVGSIEVAVDWLSELLPLDDVRRVEMQIQLALIAEAPAHPGLHTLRDEGYAGIREACRSVLADGASHSTFRSSLDLDSETTRLHVLLDGLAFHLVDGSVTVTPDVARELLTQHLDLLAVHE